MYKFTPIGDRYDFNAQLVEAKNTAFIRFGLHYDQLFNSAVLLNLTKKQLLLKNDVLSIDFIFGDSPRYNFDYYIDKGFYWSIGVNSNYNLIKDNINPSFFNNNDFAGSEKVDVSISDLTNQFFIETLVQKDLSIKVGVELKKLKISSKDNFFNPLQLNTDSYVFEDSNFFSMIGAIKFDTFDDKFYPKTGTFVEGNAQLFLSSTGMNADNSQFSYLKLNIAKAFSVFEN